MKTVFIDMDGVLADFDAEMRYLRQGPWDRKQDPPEMYLQHFFARLPVMAGAKGSVTHLFNLERSGHAKFYVATKPVRNLWCAGEKQKWIDQHFPELSKRMLMVCDKALLHGDLLIDNDHEGRWEKVFRGTLIKFDHARPEESWAAALKQVFSACRETA